MALILALLNLIKYQQKAMFMFITRRYYKAPLLLTHKILHRFFGSNMTEKVEEIIDFWFKPDHIKWFGGGKAADNEIREKYGDLVEAAFEGKLDAWKNEPRASLALLLICDQFCRSIHRGTKQFNELDPIAEALSHKFIEQKTHNHLDFSFFQRSFIYMPLMHSENRATQEISVKMFTQLAQDAKEGDEPKAAEGFLYYAKSHKEVVDMFGRFPQRNAKLGRENTPEEIEFLANLPSKYKY